MFEHLYPEEPMKTDQTFDRLCSCCSTTGPLDLSADLQAAGMRAAAWQVEELQRGRDETVARYEDMYAKLPSAVETGAELGDYLDELERDAREEGTEQGRADALEVIRPIVEELEALLDRGGRVTRKDLEPLITQLREAVK